MRYYRSRPPASQFCPTGYTSLAGDGSQLMLLRNILQVGLKLWVLEDFLIVIQRGLKLYPSTSNLAEFLNALEIISAEMQGRGWAHLPSLTRGATKLPVHPWPQSMICAFFLTLPLRQVILSLTAACFWDSTFPELFLQSTAQKPLHTCTSKQCLSWPGVQVILIPSLLGTKSPFKSSMKIC